MQMIGRQEKVQKGHLQLDHLDSLLLVHNCHGYPDPSTQVTIILFPKPLDILPIAIKPWLQLPTTSLLMTDKNQILQH